VALVGALGLMPIAWGLMRHTMSIPEGAKRAVILSVALWVVEKIVLPLLRPMLHPAGASTGTRPPEAPADPSGAA